MMRVGNIAANPLRYSAESPEAQFVAWFRRVFGFDGFAADGYEQGTAPTGLAQSFAQSASALPTDPALKVLAEHNRRMMSLMGPRFHPQMIPSTMGATDTDVQQLMRAIAEILALLVSYFRDFGGPSSTDSAKRAGGKRRNVRVSEPIAAPSATAPKSSTSSAKDSGAAAPNDTAAAPSSSGSRSHRYQDEFTRAAQKAGVPAEWATNPAMIELVKHESGFRPDAKNPNSTAFGLFQFLKSTWKSYLPEVPYGTKDPYWQAVGGFRYVKARYKTPERAWAFWQATVKKNPNLAPPDLRDHARYWISKGYAGY